MAPGWTAWIIALLLPMTHAPDGFQALLLEGRDVSTGIWWGLLFVAALAYGLVGLIMWRKYGKTTA
jgi:ABC-type polysaccharide/polyol phosphate export permease